MPKVMLSKRLRFSAAHRLWRDDLSKSENERYYGPCANEFGHGHNYELEVTLKGEVNPATDMVLNMNEIEKIVKESVIDHFDHHNLNHVKILEGINPTAENLTIFIWNRIKPAFGSLLYEVKLRETENNYSVYRGE